MAMDDGPNSDHVDLDDDDLSPQIRRFLESIADRDGEGRSRADHRRELDRERRVTRFAWTCEELSVAFDDLREDDETRTMLVEHGVQATLAELQAKCAALLQSLEG